MRLKNKIIIPVGTMLIITILAISVATFQQVKNGIALTMLDEQKRFLLIFRKHWEIKVYL